MTMNITVSVNKKFIMPLKVMLFSLYKNVEKDNVTLNIFFLNSELEKKELVDLKRFVKKYIKGRFFVKTIDEPIFSEFATDMFSRECFNRLLLPYFLPKKVKKILWIDADMIVKENITEFYNTNINDYYILATQGPNSENKIERKKELGIPLERNYFNAGLILFNIEKIRAEISEDTLRNYIYDNKTKFKYFDQDVLNVLMGDNALYFEEDIYNNQRHFAKDNNISGAQIIHYTSYMKPWKLYYDGYGDKYFWYYAGKCGYGLQKLTYCLLHPIVGTAYKIYRKIRY